jgi:hypothetical protein
MFEDIQLKSYMKNFTLCFMALAACFAVSCKKLTETPITNPTTPTPVVDSLKTGLIAYYQFNNSAADSSGNAYNASIFNLSSASDRNGKANAAYHFDGVSSYLVIKDNTALRLNNTDFSINAWVYIESYNASYGSEVLCKRGTGSTNGWNYSINGNAIVQNGGLIGATSFQVSGGTDPLAAGGKAIALNQWHMVTTVYNFTKKQITFYIDGVLDKSISNIPSPPAAATADLYIGADSQSGDYRFKGSLDELRIYNRQLTAVQITKLLTK